MADFTIGNFFRYYAVHPGDAPPKDRSAAKKYAWAFGLLSLGTIPLTVLIISKIRWKTFDDFDSEQFYKTKKLAEKRFEQPVHNEDATFNLSAVTDKITEFRPMIQSHDQVIAGLPQVKKEKQKDKAFQFKPAALKGLKDSFKELEKLEIRGQTKNVEIQAPLERAQKALEAYQLEMGRLESAIEQENNFHPNAY